MNRVITASLIAAAYVSTVWLANLLTDTFHLHPLAFGLLVPAGTWAAGLAFIVRDLLQEAGGRWWVAGGVVIGAVLSAFTTSPMLAIASGVAFAVSELADWGVYTPLRKRNLLAAVLVSGAVGAPIDTVLFLWLSPLELTWQAVAGQVLVKVGLLAPVAWLAARSIKRLTPRTTQAA